MLVFLVDRQEATLWRDKRSLTRFIKGYFCAVQTVKSILVVLLTLAMLMASAQEVAYFELAGAQLGSNTVYDMHALEDGSMVAATDHGVAIITMGGVKMLASPNALRNSYTAIQRDKHNRLYALCV